MIQGNASPVIVVGHVQMKLLHSWQVGQCHHKGQEVVPRAIPHEIKSEAP